MEQFDCQAQNSLADGNIPVSPPPPPTPSVSVPTPPPMRTPPKPAPKKKKGLIVVLVILLIAILVALVIVLIPYVKYLSGKKALQEGNHHKAQRIFSELGDYHDSKEQLKETRYQFALEQKNAGRYESALDFLKAVGVYKDSLDQIAQIEYLIRDDKYHEAERLLISKAYKDVYLIFKELGDHRDSETRCLEVLLLWESEILDSRNENHVAEFIDTVTLEIAHYDMFYNAIMQHINSHTSSSYWHHNEPSLIVYNMLGMLPESYEDTKDLRTLFDCLYSEGYTTLFSAHSALVEKFWDFAFILDLCEDDYVIDKFLEGYWSTSGGSYYLSFYKNDSNGMSCSYNLPRGTNPYGVKYYDIENLVFVLEDDSDNTLAKLYSFTLVDYDTLRVYCYYNDSSYVLYRS